MSTQSTIPADAALLPDGSAFATWEKPGDYTRTYYVDQNHLSANDTNPGTAELPFATIGRAAELLLPAERVVIAEGVYRESVHPARGGASPDEMISYEAVPGATVVIKGSIILQGDWRISNQWNLRRHDTQPEGEPRIWQIRLDGSQFAGYNPFGLLNMIPDTTFFGAKDISNYILKRGMLFCDGAPLQQVNLPYQLAGGAGRFWCEHNGLTLHVRLPDDGAPEEHLLEATAHEQVFAPLEMFLGYIRLSGLVLEHAANGFPVPQRGLVSAARGHHWIIEGCTIQHANSIGIDLGNEDWHRVLPPAEFSQHIVRGCTIRHCGIAAIEAVRGRDLLIEDNLIEHIGYHLANNSAESAGVKLHQQRNLLFRRNVIRHITGCPALWLDWDNANCRVTSNIMADINGHWSFGAMHLECNHGPNWVDNNIIWDVQGGEGWEWMVDNYKQIEREGSGICLRGMDHLLIAHNLIGACSNAAIWPVHVPFRVMNERAGTSRDIRFINNIVHGCGQAAVVFENEHNEAEGNLYSALPAAPLRLLGPSPLWLDLPAWRECFGWDRQGLAVDGEFALDADALTLTCLPPAGLHAVAGCGLQGDLLGELAVGEERLPGPFITFEGLSGKSVDPRRYPR